MSNETIGRKLADLRVLDLKEELEKRSLEVTGIKNALIERLQKALREEGHDPETYVFESLEKRTPAKKGQARTPKQEKPPILEVIEIKGEPEDPDEIDEIVDEVADEVVDEVGTVDKEQNEEGEPEEGNNDSTINDNDESINLTIEEDEEKLLHAQAPDDKDKSKTANKTTAVSCGSHGEENGKVGDAAGKSDKDEDQRDKKETTGAEVGDDKKTKSEDDKKKGEDSEQKSSSKTTSTKDEKDKTASGAKSKSSSSSRNLWVSGLSSLTRASDLKTIFSKYGKVIGAKVVTNTRTPGTRCYGYVTMSSSADASKCIEHLHRTELHGRIISVERTKSEIGSSNQSSKTEATKKHTSKSRDREKVKEGEKAKEKEVEVGKKAEPEEKAKSVTSRRSNHKSRSSRDRNNEKRRTTDRERERTRDILSFQKIREERERQRLREKERELRQEERRRREIRRKQREEEQRLAREREKLQLEREKLEREKAELLRLERERQKLEREKIELERLELKRQQMKIIHSSRVEESKRSLKRPADDRYTDSDRKRSTSDRRFEPPPPPRFDSSLTSYDRSSDKKRDDYVSSKRDDYSKRDIDVPRHSSNYQSSRDSHKESRYSDNEPRSSNFRRTDDRDGGSRSTGSKRFESSSYADRTTSGSGSQWHNSGPTSIKSFGGSNMPSSGGAGITNWSSKSSDNHWRPVDSSHDRYDRTYNERSGGGQYIEPSRPGMFVGRPQDRYGGQTSSRYENGKY